MTIEFEFSLHLELIRVLGHSSMSEDPYHFSFFLSRRQEHISSSLSKSKCLLFLKEVDEDRRQIAASEPWHCLL